MLLDITTESGKGSEYWEEDWGRGWMEGGDGWTEKWEERWRDDNRSGVDGERQRDICEEWRDDEDEDI